MRKRFYIDSDDEAERCRQSFQGSAPIVVGGADIMTGRIYSYTGVVLAVEPMASHGLHWRITMDIVDAPEPNQPAITQ
jgi:hypothetical protein